MCFWGSFYRISGPLVLFHVVFYLYHFTVIFGKHCAGGASQNTSRIVLSERCWCWCSQPHHVWNPALRAHPLCWCTSLTLLFNILGLKLEPRCMYDTALSGTGWSDRCHIFQRRVRHETPFSNCPLVKPMPPPPPHTHPSLFWFSNLVQQSWFERYLSNRELRGILTIVIWEVS